MERIPLRQKKAREREQSFHLFFQICKKKSFVGFKLFYKTKDISMFYAYLFRSKFWPEQCKNQRQIIFRLKSIIVST